MRYARLVSTAHYLPERIVDNQFLSEYLDTSDEWIQKRTGIKQRHIVSTDEGCVDMAYKAAIESLNKANITKSDLDAILVATCTSDEPFPSVACMLAGRLGLEGLFAMDLNAACSGVLYAMELVYNNMCNAHGWKHVLVIGVDAMTRVVDWRDRSSCVLFGDGAGAMLFSRDNKPGIEHIVCGSNGLGAHLLYAKNKQNPKNAPLFPWDLQSIETHMQGKEVFKHATTKMAEASMVVLSALGYGADAIDWCIPHQANKRILDVVCSKLNLDSGKLIMTVDKHANTSAASIPLALSCAFEEKKIKEGEKVLVNAFGAGFTWGAGVITV